MLRTAVVGATGAVGRELLALLTRPGMPPIRLSPVASARSAGVDIGARIGLDAQIEPVRALNDIDFATMDLVFFAAGAEVSRQVAEKAAAAGCLVIDNSSAFRAREDVPLTVPQVNPESLRHRPESNIIANPNCSTIQLVRALHPIHRLAALRRVFVSTYQAASGGGLRGLAELADDSRSVLDGRADLAPGRFGPPLAFDLVPQIGLLDDHGAAHEERKLRSEPRKIMGLPDLRVDATAVRVPVFHCHSEAVHVDLERPISVTEAEDALAATDGIRLYRSGDDPACPSPRTVEASGADRALVHVGRVRVDESQPGSLAMWVVADNLWVGAAYNAVDIMRTALDHGWLG
ncbi:aspartate-semialdehyde dehydrogenase [Actinoallomurus sp. NPDC052308]|uniref:aspartate-semialdehyde dehydrogenase n=1 Tax=Actinoallomurus sp. NPDC052308 TaxID=3155530 RepID=UPI00343A7345